MGFRFSAIGVTQGDRRKLPPSVRNQQSRGFGLKLRYEDVHYDVLPLTASHTTNSTGAWKIIEGVLLCGGPKRDHSEAFFSSLGPWGNKVPITWMQHLCLEHFDHVYSYKGDSVVVFNLWLHRACGKQVDLCGSWMHDNQGPMLMVNLYWLCIDGMRILKHSYSYTSHLFFQRWFGILLISTL